MARTTLAQFIADNNLTMVVKPAENNPHMNHMPAGSRHYRCTLRCPCEESNRKRSITIPFSMGPALTHEPEITEVLDCLASDAAGYENTSGDFEEWCSEYGYDSDSRRSEKTYRAVEKSAENLKHFLGEELYYRLLWETDHE